MVCLFSLINIKKYTGYILEKVSQRFNKKHYDTSIFS